MPSAERDRPAPGLATPPASTAKALLARLVDEMRIDFARECVTGGSWKDGVLLRALTAWIGWIFGFGAVRVFGQGAVSWSEAWEHVGGASFFLGGLGLWERLLTAPARLPRALAFDAALFAGGVVAGVLSVPR